MGSGKTLLATDFALSSKTPVLANYKIESKNVALLDIGNLLHLPYNKCKVILDECYAYLESRMSMSKLNLYMSYILFQSRKRGIDFILTAQLASSIDNRFIQLADIIIVAQREKDGFKYYVTNNEIVKIFKITFVNAEKIWCRYDTSEVILPPQMQNLETEIQILDRKKLKIRLTELEKMFKKEYKDIKVSHALVDNFLLDIDESDVYGSYLYARLQKPR